MARTIIIKDNRTGFKYKTKNENILVDRKNNQTTGDKN